jgi:hypothetical protein
MDRAHRQNAESVGAYLRRYMWARHKCVGGEALPGSLAAVADQIQQGLCEFGGICIDPKATLPIIWDRDQPEFFRAIIQRDDMAMPGLANRAGWRVYVHYACPMPNEPETKPSVLALAGNNRQRAGI